MRTAGQGITVSSTPQYVYVPLFPAAANIPCRLRLKGFSVLYHDLYTSYMLYVYTRYTAARLLS